MRATTAAPAQATRTNLRVNLIAGTTQATEHASASACLVQDFRYGNGLKNMLPAKAVGQLTSVSFNLDLIVCQCIFLAKSFFGGCISVSPSSMELSDR